MLTVETVSTTGKMLITVDGIEIYRTDGELAPLEYKKAILSILNHWYAANDLYNPLPSPFDDLRNILSSLRSA